VALQGRVVQARDARSIVVNDEPAHFPGVPEGEHGHAGRQQCCEPA
jgi:hypothetical protein